MTYSVASVANESTVTVNASPSLSAAWDGTYFEIFDFTGSVRVWFDYSVGATAPAAGTSTVAGLVEVAINGLTTQAQLGGAIATAIDGLAEFSAEYAAGVVTISDARGGVRSAIVDGNLPNSDLTLATATAGTDITLSVANSDTSNTNSCRISIHAARFIANDSASL